MADTIDPVKNQREEPTDRGNLLDVAVRDAHLTALGCFRYAITDNAVHTFIDVVGGQATWDALITAGWRTALIRFETYGVRLVLNSGAVWAGSTTLITTPNTTTDGMPRDPSVDHNYTIANLSVAKFCNAVAGQNGIVHLEALA